MVNWRVKREAEAPANLSYVFGRMKDEDCAVFLPEMLISMRGGGTRPPGVEYPQQSIAEPEHKGSPQTAGVEREEHDEHQRILETEAAVRAFVAETVSGVKMKHLDGEGFRMSQSYALGATAAFGRRVKGLNETSVHVAAALYLRNMATSPRTSWEATCLANRFKEETAADPKLMQFFHLGGKMMLDWHERGDAEAPRWLGYVLDRMTEEDSSVLIPKILDGLGGGQAGGTPDAEAIAAFKREHLGRTSENSGCLGKAYLLYVISWVGAILCLLLLALAL